MAKKLFVYLLSIVSVFTIGVNLIYGEETLVFCDDTYNASALSISPDGKPIRKELMKGLSCSSITRSGYFTTSEGGLGNRTWYKGRIDSSLNITKQVLPSIPPGASRVTISEDGKRIAWKTGESYRKSELTIEEYNGSESKVLRKISVDGMIPNFSWSPNSDLLAYFWGPPEAHLDDGFSLMLIDMKNPEKPPLEIAPPSFGIGVRLNPGRSIAPEWSPDGKFIRFEARYRSISRDEKNPFSDWFYMVSLDGRTLVSCKDTTLCFQAPLRLERIGDIDSGEFIIVETDAISKKEKRDSDNILKILSRIPSLSPSGKKVAYDTNNEIFIYDVEKKITLSYGSGERPSSTMNGYFGFFWITPKD